ncbi:hypothetical protein [Oceanisphaera sp. W20_SRM_FM3]|uniref:hypothetical protein n=1 Tax=Oceanisphaera sp. W20_SRM_FM3 TaxID=3240267 RepID=UPI003F988638
MTDKNHWQLLETEKYTCPTPAPVTWLQLLWRRWLQTLGVKQQHEFSAQDLQDITEIPDVSSLAAQSAFASYLAKQEQVHSEVHFLVDPPFSGTAAMARSWAWQQGRVLLSPPTADQITQCAVDTWWQQQAYQGTAWLIDDLARYFLRTPQGLAFIRVWRARVLAGEFGAGLVVCDSWAFAFLRRDWPLTMPSSHCLAPTSTSLLQQVGITGSHRQLAHLSGEARGNLGVAWALWRCKYLQQQTVPSLPVAANDTTAFILYTLLLHRGLSGAELQAVLSNVSGTELKMQLLRLVELGIIIYESEHWRVTAIAYGVVREFLAGRDYLLDDF